MRALLVGVLLVGCSSPPRGAAGSGEVDALREEIAGLVDRLASLEGDLAEARAYLAVAVAMGQARIAAEIAELGARFDAFQAIRPGKVPHLVTTDGQDLGVYLGGWCTWNPAIGGEVCFQEIFPVWFFFTETGCTGARFTNSPDRASMHYLFPVDRHALRRDPPMASAVVRSYLRPATECTNYIEPVNQDDLTPLVDTGLAFPPFTLDQLTVEMR